MQITGLNPFSSLSKTQRDRLLGQLVARGLPKSTPNHVLETIYNNNKYIEKYGLESFESHSAQQRKAIWENDVYQQQVQPLFEKIGSPFFKDDKGDTWFDPSKGFGEDWFKYDSMDWNHKMQLIDAHKEGRWKTNAELEKYIAEKDEKEEQYYKGLQSSISPNDQEFYSVSFHRRETDKGNTIRQTNQNILDRIWTDDAKAKEQSLAGAVDQFKSTYLQGKSENEIKEMFLKNLHDENSPTNILKAYFDEDGYTESAVAKKFSTEEMANYIAKKAVYEKAMGKDLGNEVLNNWATRWINSNEDFSEKAKHLAKDVAIGTVNTIASSYNGIRRFGLLGQEANVFKDLDGNIVRTEDVTKDKNDPSKFVSIVRDDDGNVMKDKNGNVMTKPVSSVTLSKIALDDLGYDSEGNKRDWFTNMQFWLDAEQFGTMDEKEQKKYKEIGYSPYSMVWEPGDDSHILYDTAKMMSFVIADTGLALIPGTSALAGAKAMAKAAQITGKASSILSATGKTLSTIGAAGQKILPVTSAIGIGHQYEQGKFQENMYDNLSKVELSIQDQAQKYTQSEEGSAKVRQRTQELYNEMLKKAIKESGIKNVSLALSKLPEEVKQEMMRSASAQAYAEVAQEHAENWKKENAQQYEDAKTAAIENAADGALAAGLTTTAKYIGANYGWRSFMFQSPAAKTASRISKNARTGVEEIGKRLTYKQKFANFKTNWKANSWQATKAAAGTFWNGAWTNATDELQSWGGTFISRGAMDDYLEGMFDPEAKATSAMADPSVINTALRNIGRYLEGANHALMEKHTYEAGLVGGLGSWTSLIPNPVGILNLREKIRATDGVNKGKMVSRIKDLIANKRYGELISNVISNGLLNQYYTKKASDRDINFAVNYINDMLDKDNEFKSINQVYALDVAKDKTVSEQDSEAVSMTKAAASMLNLASLMSDATTAEVAQSSSIVRNAMDTIEKLLPENQKKLKPKEREQILQKYYQENPTVAVNEKTAEEAFEQLGKNAQAMKTAQGRVADAEIKIQEYEKANGIELDRSVRNSMIINHVLQDITREQMDRNSETIGVAKESMSTDSSELDFSRREPVVESYGDTKNRQHTLTGLRKAVKPVLDEYTKLQEQVKLDKEALDQYDRDHPDIMEDDEKRQELVEDYEESKLKADLVKEELDIYNTEIDALQRDLETQDVEPSSRVLTAEEILNLNPQDRARMMNVENRGRFSQEQQQEIERLESELKTKRPGALEAIQQQAILDVRQQNINKSLRVMSENPVAASSQLKLADAANDNMAIEIASEVELGSLRDSVDGLIQAGRDKEDSEDTIQGVVYNQLRVLNPRILENALKDGRFSDVKQSLEDALSWSKTASSVSQISDDILEGLKDSAKETHRQGLEALLDKVLEGSRNGEDFIKNMQEQIDSIELKDGRGKGSKKVKKANKVANKWLRLKKGFLEDVLTKYKQTEEAKKATVERDKKREKEREKEIERKKEEQRKKKEQLKREAAKPTGPIQVGETHLYNEREVVVKSIDTENGRITYQLKGDKTTFSIPLDKAKTLKRIAKPATEKKKKVLTGKERLDRYKDRYNEGENPEGLTVTVGNESVSNGKVLHNEMKKAETFNDLLKSKKVTWSPSANDLMEAIYDSVKADPTSISAKDLEELFEDQPPKEQPKTDPTAVKKGDIFQSSKHTIRVTKVSTNQEEPFVDYEQLDKKGNVVQRGSMPLEDLVDSWTNVTETYEVPKPEEEKKPAEKKTETRKKKTPPAEEETTEKKSPEASEEETGEETGEEEQQAGEPKAGDVYVREANGRTFRFTLTDVDEDYVYGTFENDRLKEVQSINKQAFLSSWTKEGKRSSNKKRQTPEEDVDTTKKQDETDDIDKRDEEEDDVKKEEDEEDEYDPEQDEVEALEPESEITDVIPGIAASVAKKDAISDDEEYDDDTPEAVPATLLGNGSFGYEMGPLKNPKIRRLVPRSQTTNSAQLRGYFEWLEQEGIDLQAIVDHEVNAIKNLDIPIRFMQVHSRKNAQRDNRMEDYTMLVVPYNEKVKRIHKEERGGVIEANGQKWLIIGNYGYRSGETAASERKMKLDLTDAMKRRKAQYIRNNPTARFYVDEAAHTKIDTIVTGKIVMQLPGETEKKNRSITELLDSKERNPRGIKLHETKWLIIGNKRNFTVRVSKDRNKIYPVRDKDNNKGRVFLLVPTAKGGYAPIAIRPVGLKELKKDSALVKTINGYLAQLRSENHKDRLDAIKKLRQYLFFGTNQEYNILIGTRLNSTLTIKRGNMTLDYIDLSDMSISASDVIESIYRNMGNVLVHIGLGTLTDRDSLQKYADAGALNTAVGVLATVNSQYSVYACNDKGDPIIMSPVGNTKQSGEKGNSSYRSSSYNSVKILDEINRYDPETKTWQDESGNEITDEDRIQQNEYALQIKQRDLLPSKTLKNTDFYILDESRDNPVVVKVDKVTGEIVKLNNGPAIAHIKSIESKVKAEARERNAQDALKDIENQQPKSLSQVDLGIEEEENENEESGEMMSEVLSREDLERTAIKINFSRPKNSKSTEKQEKKQKKEKQEEEKKEKKPDTSKKKPKSKAETLIDEEKKGSMSLFDVIEDSTYGEQFDSLIDEMSEKWPDMPDAIDEIADYIQEKTGQDINNITDVDKFFENIRGCAK